MFRMRCYNPTETFWFCGPFFSQTWSRRSSLKNRGLLKKPNIRTCCNSCYIIGQRVCNHFVPPGLFAENDSISRQLHEKQKCPAILTHVPQRFSILTDSFNEPCMKGHHDLRAAVDNWRGTKRLLLGV